MLFLVACDNSPQTNQSATANMPAVEVFTGPTPIPMGDARSPGDITVTNGLFAVSFAVDTAAPWGVARGGILDIGILRDGKPEADFVSLVDFMPNRWSAWPTTYQRVFVEHHNPGLAVIRSQRDWGEVQLDTRFEIRAGSKLVRLYTRVKHKGSADLGLLRTGYVAWPNGGTTFGMPGLPPAIIDSPDNPDGVADTVAQAKWSASYAEGWTLGLHTLFSKVVDYGGRDRYLEHRLLPGDSREFEGWLEINGSADLAEMAASDIELRELPAGQLTGSVRTLDGSTPESAAVIALKNDAVFAWTLAGAEGEYTFGLPAGDYEIYATAKHKTRGAAVPVSIADNRDQELNFDDVQAAAAVEFSVVSQATGAPLDALLELGGDSRPVIAFFGKERHYTELAEPGRLRVSLPAGAQTLSVSAGAGFTSQVQVNAVDLVAGEERQLKLQVPVLARPANEGWYSADLHHHSDVLDGFTPPEFVLRSELAAGVDLAFLSDHDSVVNNAEMAKLASGRDLPFIAGTELSPSWGHFNAYPIAAGESPDIAMGSAEVQEVFAEARRLGASVIQVNHPFNPNYGYLDSKARDGGTGNIIPGQYSEGFDLLEIETSRSRNEQTMLSAWQLWNLGKRVYLAAGSDVHDIWFESIKSGEARSFVYLDEAASVTTFVAALKQGRSYASLGPLIFPGLMFGSEVEHSGAEPLQLTYGLQAVNGLRSIRLIERGIEIQRRTFAPGEIAPEERADIVFAVHPQHDTWYSVEVEDMKGKKAYSNPLWVTKSVDGS